MVRAAALLTATQHACHAEPFAEAVAPFLSQHCVACHNSETHVGGFRLDTLKADLGSIHTAERWAEVMGRHSGFIACYAALAEPDANYVLIPEVPFALDGPNNFLDHLMDRVKRSGHAVVVAAEGAGQDLLAADQAAVDASGNRRLSDIGLFLKERIGGHFDAAGVEINLKYIDPSYQIRSVEANP